MKMAGIEEGGWGMWEGGDEGVEEDEDGWKRREDGDVGDVGGRQPKAFTFCCYIIAYSAVSVSVLFRKYISVVGKHEPGHQCSLVC